MTHKFSIAGQEGYFTVGLYEDGSPGEIFIKMSKEGSTISGLMDSFAVSVSLCLQYGVPLKSYVHALTNMSFAPAGMTDDPDVRTATSIVDYIFKRLAKEYLSLDDQLELGLANIEDLEAAMLENQTDLLGDTPLADQSTSAPEPAPAPHAAPVQADATAPLCDNCGNQTQRAGTCYVCTACGTTSGCS